MGLNVSSPRYYIGRLPFWLHWYETNQICWCHWRGL